VYRYSSTATVTLLYIRIWPIYDVIQKQRYVRRLHILYFEICFKGFQCWAQRLLPTGVAACTAVDVGVKLVDHPQRLLICVHLVGVVPQLPYLLVRVTHDACARPVALRCHVITHMQDKWSRVVCSNDCKTPTLRATLDTAKLPTCYHNLAMRLLKWTNHFVLKIQILRAHQTETQKSICIVALIKSMYEASAGIYYQCHMHFLLLTRNVPNVAKRSIWHQCKYI